MMERPYLLLMDALEPRTALAARVAAEALIPLGWRVRFAYDDPDTRRTSNFVLIGNEMISVVDDN